ISYGNLSAWLDTLDKFCDTLQRHCVASKPRIDDFQFVKCLPNVVTRACEVIHYFLLIRAYGKLCHRERRSLRRSILSSVRPGPNASARILLPSSFAVSVSQIRFRTNNTDGDDMLPYSRNTSRANRLRSGGRFICCSTASSILFPPGWIAK